MPYLWIKFGMHAFLRNDNDYFESESASVSDILANISVIFSWQSTGHDPRNDWTRRPSYAVSIQQHLHKGQRLQKQNICWHWIQMGENSSRLDFNFILLPSPTADKNWISQLSSVALFVFEKCCRSACSNWFLFFLKRGKIYWMLSLFCIMAILKLLWL